MISRGPRGLLRAAPTYGDDRGECCRYQDHTPGVHNRIPPTSIKRPLLPGAPNGLYHQRYRQPPSQTFAPPARPVGQSDGGVSPRDFCTLSVLLGRSSTNSLVGVKRRNVVHPVTGEGTRTG